MTKLAQLLKEVRGCQECAAKLPHAPRPILAAHRDARIVIIGQAPGARVYESGVAWDDASGKRLRDWMGISREDFYDPSIVALVPMGFCYPGKGASGDLPPRPECAPLWHERLLGQMKKLTLTLLVGSYAQNYYLGSKAKKTLTETVQSWREFAPAQFPLPHPSPRNNIWLKKNEWFESELTPKLRQRVKRALRG